MAGDAGFGGWVGGLQFGDGGGDAVWVGRGDGYCCAEFETGFCDAVADAWAVDVRGWFVGDDKVNWSIPEEPPMTRTFFSWSLLLYLT